MARTPTLAATTAMAVAVAVGVPATPSAADCSGPRLHHEPATVDRGATVHVEGEGWVAECWDTFPRPPSDPPRAPASTDIEIHVVQGDRRVLVAEGDAGEDYRFAVDVPIPTTLDPGPATIEAGTGATSSPARSGGRPVAIVVSDAPAPDRTVQPVGFVGDRVEPTTATTTSAPAAADEQAGAPAGGVPSADTELNPWPIIGGALAMLVAIALLVFGVRRRIDEEAEDGPGGAADPER
ncbi:MAG: hypothetical protein KDA98_10600 [Acidimicrobiales bacterium]|nr:hypothetical protein [Acidimicrobiales bacterium]